MHLSIHSLAAILALSLVACGTEPDTLTLERDSAGRPAYGRVARVYRITHLPSLGGTSSSGNGISNPGLVAGSSNLPVGASAHAVIWRDGVVEDLGTLGGPSSSVVWPGLNGSGMVVGIAETSEPGGATWACRFFFPASAGNQCLGFVWEGGVMTPLPTLGGTNGFATGVNNRGQVVGWAENLVEDPTCNAPVMHQFRAVLWEPKRGAMRELPPFPGDSTSAATAINERGQVVGISGRCANAVGGFSAQHAVLWDSDGSVIELGDLGGDAWHTPMDINEHGDVVGFSNPADVEGDAFGIHAFRWTRHGGIEDLKTLPGDGTSQALGINDRRVAVGVSTGPAGNRAVLWEGTAPVDLNSRVEPGYEGTLLIAGHINDGGVITGSALDAESGDVVAFIATPQGQGR